jgi:hypothetical protein
MSNLIKAGSPYHEIPPGSLHFREILSLKTAGRMACWSGSNIDNSMVVLQQLR